MSEGKPMSILSLTAHELAQKLQSREVSSEEVTRRLLEHIGRFDGRLGAYLSMDAQGALEAARRLDKRRLSGERLGALAGIPMAVKDNICTRGRATTCASKILANFRPPYDAHVVEKLAQADAIIIGKTNMDEFAMGSSTENSGLGKTCNPWCLDCIPGGSSGGSAVAVASDEAFLALGSDTGGSIRQPAALVGCVGLKPTYGLVSRYGLVAFASSLDQIGPLTKDVRDAAMLLNVIAGHDPRDSTSAPQEAEDYLKDLNRPLEGVRVGCAREYFGEGLDPEIAESVKAAISKLEEIGCSPVEVSLPHGEYAVATYYIIATAEASSNLARYDGVHYGHRGAGRDIVELYARSRQEGFGPEVKRRIMLGNYVLSAGYYDAYYLKALKVRRLIREDYEKAFQKVDFIVGPTSPTPAFRFGEKMESPLAMYLSDVYTISTNLAGNAAISIPCGFTRAGLPIGLQIQGPMFSEKRLLRCAAAAERRLDCTHRIPELLRSGE